MFIFLGGKQAEEIAHKQAQSGSLQAKSVPQTSYRGTDTKGSQQTLDASSASSVQQSSSAPQRHTDNLLDLLRYPEFNLCVDPVVYCKCTDTSKTSRE